MKKYVIIVSGVSVTAKDAFTAYLGTSGCAWWHWMPDVWLVIDGGVSPSAEKWRELVRAQMVMSPQGDVLCIEAGEDISANLPRASHDWFRKERWPQPLLIPPPGAK